MSKVSFNTLIEKTSDWDKDERFMATNDICNELSKDIKLDEALERRICQAILKQLDDSSNDVQSVAVKCLAILLKKVQQPQVGEISEKLSALLVEGKETLRDIYSIGLRTLIVDVPEEMGPIVADKLVGRLLNGISRASHEEVKRECLENMSILLHRFGHILQHEHEDIMNVVIRLLENEKANLRKKAAVCLGNLAVVLNDSLLSRLVDSVLAQIENASRSSPTRSGKSDMHSLIHAIGTISRTVGHRLGKYLNRLIPLFLQFCGDATDENQQTDAANELRENCFPGLESFVQRCPRESSQFLQSVSQCAISFMKYDPNYSYDEDDGAAMEEEEADADEEYEQDEDEYCCSDDDDNSWKVRKAAIRVINATISSQSSSSNLPELYTIFADELISRFKEREENVRVDVITCFAHLLQVTNSNEMSLLTKRFSLVALMNASNKQLNGQSAKTKSAVFAMLRSLVSLMEQSAMDTFVASFVTYISKNLAEKNQTLQLDAVQFLRVVLKKLSPEAMQPFVPMILPLLIANLRGDWYKLTTESINALRELLPLSQAPGISRNSLALSFYGAIFPLLETQGGDAEIHDSSIQASGDLFFWLGDELRDQFPNFLAIILKSLDRETTRISSLRAVQKAATNKLGLQLNEFSELFLTALSKILLQQNRIWRYNSLQAIHAILLHSPIKDATVANNLTAELCNLIEDHDLQSAMLTLGILQLLVPIASKDVLSSVVLPKAIEFSSSSLLTSSASTTLNAVLKMLVVHQVATSSHLIQGLFERSVTVSFDQSSSVSKHSLVTLSRSIAGVCSVASAEDQKALLSKLMTDLKSAKTAEQLLSLYVIGNLDSSVQRNFENGFIDLLRSQLLICFDSSHDDIKSAASATFGRLASANMDSYLPTILNSLATDSNVYLVLSSIREIIETFESNALDFRPHLATVLPVLIVRGSSQDEGTRNVAAECLGLLAAIYPDQLFPVLSNLVQESGGESAMETESQCDEFAARRLTAITALRFALTRPHASNSEVSNMMSAMLKQLLPLLSRPNLEVRKAALLLVNVVGHHNPHLAIPFLRGVFPSLLEMLLLKVERVVDLGPFKHKVDDGLPLRKAALSCIDTLVSGRLAGLINEQRYAQLLHETTPDEGDIPNLNDFVDAFLVQLPTLLGDKDEVKVQVHQLLVKLAKFYSSSVSLVVEGLVDPLEKTVSKKISTESMTGPEIERSLELIKSAVRAIFAVNSLVDTSLSRKWIEFIDRLIRREPIASMWKALLDESSSYSIY